MNKHVSLFTLFLIVLLFVLISGGCQERPEIPDRTHNLEKQTALAEEIKTDIDHVQNVRLENWLTIDRYSESWAQFVQNVKDLQKAMADIKKKVEELEDSLLEDKKTYADEDED